MKLIVIEGGENVGKTTIINKISNLFKDNIGYAKFPSNELMLKYKDVLTGNDTITMNFINDLIDEELKVLKSINNNVIIIDRFHLSTFVYQGHNFPSRKFINSMYNILYTKLGITSKDIMTFVLTKEYPKNNEERTEAQIINDDNSKQIKLKYKELLSSGNKYDSISTVKIFSEDDYIIDDKFIYYEHGDYKHRINNDLYIFDTICNYIHSQL